MKATTLNSLRTIIERALYSKVSVLVEEVRKQEVAHIFEQVLVEADPKPKVEKDHMGQPVPPTEDQLKAYFEGMASIHIEDQLKAAHDRWKEAAEEAEKHKGSDSVEANFAKANLKTVDAEIAIAGSVLRDRNK
jgi:hypothetical protein